MIKLPEKAPDWKSIAAKGFKRIFQFSENETILHLIDKTDQLYYYWDKVRAQPLSKEYDKSEVWTLIRLRRHMNSISSPLLDTNNQPFTFWLTDEMQKNLHWIDQSTGGHLALWDPVNDQKASTRYMTSSLIAEAITSSQIEGAVTTIKDAKKMLLERRKPKNNSEQMIYNNYLTMQSIKEASLKDLSMDILLSLHQSITKDTLDSPEDEGRLRTSADNVQVVTNYGEILFTPPRAEEVTKRLEALIQFANDKNEKPFINPVVKAIILHFWIAYIHPFTDGNGRLARTLFYWYMLKHNYWLFEYTSISKTILKRTSKYAYAYLYSEHDDNDMTYFIHFHINVIMDAVEDLKKHIQEEAKRTRQIQIEITNYPDLNMRQANLIQHALSHPDAVFTIKVHKNSNGIAYQTARTDLLQLEEKKLLKTIKKGKTLFFVPEENFREKLIK